VRAGAGLQKDDRSSVASALHVKGRELAPDPSNASITLVRYDPRLAAYAPTLGVGEESKRAVPPRAPPSGNRAARFRYCSVKDAPPPSY
jgi:hypothetical protein